MMGIQSKKPTTSTITYPSAQEWDEITQWARGCNMLAVQHAVKQAIGMCEQIRDEKQAEASRKDVVRKAKRMVLLLSNLEHELTSEGSLWALRRIKADDEVAKLLSFSAVADVTHSEAMTQPVDLASIIAFDAETKWRQEAFSLVAIEQHFLERKKAAIGNSPGESMRHAIQQMKAPINAWLYSASRSTGGRPVNTAREALLFCLIMDYETIFQRPLEKKSEQRLKDLCTHLLPACRVPSRGLEEAVTRSLAKHKACAEWARLPPMSSGHFGEPNLNVPDDEESPLSAAKPRVKQ